MAIKVLVVDDHPVVRVGVKQLVAGSEVHVVGEAENGIEALDMLKKLSVDLVLMDVRMPEYDGLRCLGEIKSQHPQMPVLMFSSYANPTFIARSVALRANGYLTKDASREKLISAIMQIAAGGSAWSSDDMRRVSGSLSEAGTDIDLEVPLTKRENEVLKQLAFGLTNKEIAQALGISYETVKEHVQHILRKLGVSDRTQAAVWAVRAGLA